jgi:hypothetical protein
MKTPSSVTTTPERTVGQRDLAYVYCAAGSRSRMSEGGSLRMLTAVVLVAALGSGVSSEGRPPLREGAQVRVLRETDPPGTAAPVAQTSVLGRVSSVQGDHMTLETSSGAVVIPLERITRLEVSHRSRNLKRGAVIGGLVGFAVVTTLFVAAFDADDDYSISTGESFAIGALLGLPAGGLVGLGVGALAPEWHDVPVPRAGAGRRVTAWLTIRF